MNALAFPRGLVRVHVLPVEEARDEDRALLSEAECAQADRYHFERDRALYVTAHAAVRRLLAAELGTAAEALDFTRGPKGRPELPGGELGFSLSHSGDRVLVALGATTALGVDVEVFRDNVDIGRLAARNFTPFERAEIEAAPDPRRAFFRVWTRKEAYVKALGLGLLHPLADFDVTAGERAAFAAFRDGSALGDWSLFDLALGGERAGALAVRAPAGGLRVELVEAPA